MYFGSSHVLNEHAHKVALFTNLFIYFKKQNFSFQKDEFKPTQCHMWDLDESFRVIRAMLVNYYNAAQSVHPAGA